MNFNYKPFLQFTLGLMLGWLLFSGGVSPVTVNFISSEDSKVSTESIECLKTGRSDFF